jgi:flagellar biosynthesis protein FliQ
VKLKLGFNRVLIIGLIMGVAAAALQAFFQVQPPVAYGISFFGHPSDLLTWITNNLLETDWPIRDPFIVFPALTVIGVFIGSFIAATRNKELKLRSGPVRKNFFAFIFGFLVINLGLLWGACPIRTALFVSYGNVLAVIALASIVVGVVLAIAYVRFRVKKGAIQ